MYRVVGSEFDNLASVWSFFVSVTVTAVRAIAFSGSVIRLVVGAFSASDESGCQ